MNTSRHGEADTRFLDVFILVSFLVVSYMYWLGVAPVRYAIAALILIVVAQCVIAFERHRDLFHPSVFMLGYLATVALGPISYMALTGNALSRVSMGNLEDQTIFVMITAVGAWMTVAAVFSFVRRIDRSDRPATEGSDDGPSKIVESTGRSLLYVALSLKIAQVSMFSGRRYGEAQTTFDLFSTVSVAAEGLLLVSIAAIAYGRSRSAQRQLLGGLDWAVLAIIYFLAAALLGSRSELIAPSLLLLWFYSRRGRVRIGLLLLSLPLVLFVSNYIGNTRGTELAGQSALGPVGRWLVDIASPVMITNDLVVLRSLSGLPFTLLDTYAAAVQYMIPGVIARSLFSGTPDTGAFVYRQVIGYDDPDSGFGFSQFSEAYLAGGVAGVIVFAAVLSLVSNWSYWRTSSHATVFSQLLFPLILSTFPYGLRSDALGFGKSIIYPLIIVSVIAVTARTVVGKPAKSTGERR